MLKLKPVDSEIALLDPLAGDEATFDSDLPELELLRLDVSELRAELGEMRAAFDETVRLAVRRDRIRTAARVRRQHRTRGKVMARAILNLVVALLTLCGAIAGIGVAVTVIHFWGGSGLALVAAVVFGTGVALLAWVCAALAAVVLETADSIRDLPV